MLLCCLLIFFIINFFGKLFHDYHQSIKQFGFRWGPVFLVWSGYKLNAKVVSRWHWEAKISGLIFIFESVHGILVEQWWLRSDLGDNWIKKSYLGMYYVGYTVRNVVLLWHVSRAVKHDFWKKKIIIWFLTVYQAIIHLHKWLFWIWSSPF